MFPFPFTSSRELAAALVTFLPPFLRDDRNCFLCLTDGLYGNKVWWRLEYIRESYDWTLARCLITGTMRVVVQLSFDVPPGAGLSAHR